MLTMLGFRLRSLRKPDISTGAYPTRKAA